jgi:hypothetical protein
MSENEWKPVFRLFSRKMISCYETRKVCGSCVEPSPLKKFGSMFDAEAIHTQIPSNIQPFLLVWVLYVISPLLERRNPLSHVCFEQTQSRFSRRSDTLRNPQHALCA